MAGIVIVGAGHAGVKVAASLRTMDPDAPITLLSAESQIPYHRPPLSKKSVFDAALPMELLQANGYYEKANIDLRLNTTVTSINPDVSSVTLADGQQLNYQQLVIATGTKVRRLPVPGGERAMSVYTYADIQTLGPRLQSANRIAVIGGGFIGCEIAAGALKIGKQVSLLITGPRALRKSVAPILGETVTKLHRQQGMDIRTGCQVLAITEQGVQTNQGFVQADLIISGIGAQANMQLAQAADLTTGHGILVDEFGRTSHSHIYAVGDVAEFPYGGDLLRLESIQNATDQGANVAANIIAERHHQAPKAYTPTPWFWSDQGDLKLQMAGLGNLDAEHKVLPGNTPNNLTVVHLSKGRMMAVDTLNMPANHLAARKLLEMKKPITWAMIEACDFDLKKLFKQLR